MAAVAFEPAVETALIQRLEWLTDVLPSYNGKEQRLRLRSTPRRRFDFAAAFGDDAARARAENFFTANHGQAVDLPIWPDASPLAAAISAGATSIPVDTAYKDYTANGQAVISNGTLAEVVTVSAVAANSITVSALTLDWAAGSRVAPARSARMEARISSKNPWPAVMSARLQFLLERGWSVTPAAESADYQGYPVKVPDTAWVLDGNTDFERLLAEFDPAIGNRAVYDNTETELPARQYRIALPTREDIWNYHAWLFARAGRLNPFWLASGQDDLEVTATIGSAATLVSVANTGYAALGTPVGRRDIMVETVGGTRYYRRITNATEIDEDTEQLTISSALGATLTTADIARVSFLRFCRLAADAVEIAHHWDGVADSKIAVKTLRDDL